VENDKFDTTDNPLDILRYGTHAYGFSDERISSQVECWINANNLLSKSMTIAVDATNIFGEIVFFSKYESYVDIFVPGMDIKITYINNKRIGINEDTAAKIWVL